MDISQLFAVRDKRVLVTGGSRGIGRMIAEGFVRGGAQVAITARKPEQLAATVDILSAWGRCEGRVADLSDEAGRAGLATWVSERFGGSVDVLVNNAGATWGASLDDYPVAGWHKVMDTNVIGLFELTRLLLPALRASALATPPARVINIGSVDAMRVPGTENYAYAASKAAVHMTTRQLARRLAADAITVNAIAPGPFHSKMTAYILDEHADEVAETVPLGRIGEPEDVAGTALFLASRAGAYLSGAVIPVDGGTQA